MIRYEVAGMSPLAARRTGRPVVLAICLLMSLPGVARASAPEQIYEPGPEAGHWNLEYNGQFGQIGSGERPHNFELFGGVADGLALGLELEAEASEDDLVVEEIGIGAILALNGGESPVRFGLLVQADMGIEGEFQQFEARLIGERRADRWRALGNIIVRRLDADQHGTLLGYALVADRKLIEKVRLGVEASGQAAKLGGFTKGFESAHYIGPSINVCWELDNERELELGLKYLRRLDGDDGYSDTIRLVVGFEF